MSRRLSRLGHRGIAVLLVPICVWGCASEQRPTVARRFTAGDTVVVESSEPGLRNTITPREVARYGRVDGPVDYILDDIYTFAVDDDGAVYVQDRSGGIRQFRADGTFLKYLAGQGAGPGEVRYATAMDATGSGKVAVLDLGNVRVSVFGGPSALWSTRMPEGFPAYREGGITFHDDGTLWVAVNPPYPATGGITFPRPVFARVRDDGAFVDTVYVPASATNGCPTLSDAQHRAGFWEDRRDPYVPKVKWALGPDGTFVVGCPARYSFTIRSPSGALTRVVREWSPVAVSDEERDFRNRMPVPHAGTTLPAYAKVIVPGDGRIWVWPRQPDVKEALPPDVVKRFRVTHTWAIASQGVFDVFDTTGNWLAVVRLPREARYSGYPTEPNIVIRGDTLWAVAQDSNDVEYIVRYDVSQLDAGR